MIQPATMPSETPTADAALRARQRVVPGDGGIHHALPEGRVPASAGPHTHVERTHRFMQLWTGVSPPSEVEAAAQAQAARGDCFNGPGEVMVDLAEDFVAMVPHADWAMFQKNGGDATTACVTIARAGTTRRKVLVARGAYHGALPWCSPVVAGITSEDRAHLVHFDYNDVASLQAAAAEAGNDLAAVLVTAFRHDMGRDLELPTAEFAKAARAICDAAGAALIIDEVRAGLRLDLRGSWEALGVRPDLAAWSKAIAKGNTVTATTVYEAATKVFVTDRLRHRGVARPAAHARDRRAGYIHATPVARGYWRTGTALLSGRAARRKCR